MAVLAFPNWTAQLSKTIIHRLLIVNMERNMANFAKANVTTLKKTASYYVLHIVVAASVAYAVTGDLLVSFTLSLLEPTVQAFAFFFHEKFWDRRLKVSAAAQKVKAETPGMRGFTHAK